MSRDPAALLDAIHADPFDDELRRVYGDLLIELGDPRGELIQLQFARLESGATPERSMREQALIDRHAADWIGPIAAVADRFAIERGFLETCSVPWHRKAYNVNRVVGHPAWSTVRRAAVPSVIFLDPVMRALRTLTAGNDDGIEELCAGSVERPLTELVCSFYRPREAVFRAASLPKLERLTVGLDESRRLHDIGPLLGSQIRELALDRVRVEYDITSWFEAANAAMRVPILELREWQWDLTRWSFRHGRAGYDQLVVHAKRRASIVRPLRALVGKLSRVDIFLDGVATSSELEQVVASFPVGSIVTGAP